MKSPRIGQVSHSEPGKISFLIDKDTPGLTVTKGSRSVSHRGFHHCELVFDQARVNKRQILGEVHHGFDVANTWLGATRLTVAAQCVGRAQRALDGEVEWAAIDPTTDLGLRRTGDARTALHGLAHDATGSKSGIHVSS